MEAGGTGAGRLIREFELAAERMALEQHIIAYNGKWQRLLRLVGSPRAMPDPFAPQSRTSPSRGVRHG